MVRFPIPTLGLLFVGVGVGANGQAPPAPGRMVDVGGWQMHINCLGTRLPGQPLVVFEAGSSDSSVEWSLVQPEVSRLARVCSYDRSGSGWSELGPYPHTNRQIVYELETLLARAGEAPPYILVGHSMGGRYVQMFATARRSDVVGMVLVDSNHEDDLLFFNGNLRREWESATGQAIPEAKKSGALKMTDIPADALKQINAAVARDSLHALDPPMNKLPNDAQQARKWMHSRPEWIASNNSDFGPDEVAEWKRERERNPQPLGGMPLIVLTRDQPAYGGSREEEESRKQNQANLATLSSRGRQIVVSDTGHHIHIDQPEAVIRAILQILSEVSE